MNSHQGIQRLTYAAVLSALAAGACGQNLGGQQRLYVSDPGQQGWEVLSYSFLFDMTNKSHYRSGSGVYEPETMSWGGHNQQVGNYVYSYGEAQFVDSLYFSKYP